MSLREKDSIFNIYIKKIKKSICSVKRIYLFFIFSLIVLIISPLIINVFIKVSTDIKRISLTLSPRCEELFGEEVTETLLRNFRETAPDLLIQQLNSDQQILRNAAQASDIIIFTEAEYNALVSAGVLLELNPFINDDEMPDRPVLALTLVSFMDLLFYNIDLLSAAGFDRPPKTREEYLAYAKAVSDGNNSGAVAGAAISLSLRDKQALSRDIFSWIWAAGSDFWPAEPPGDVPFLDTSAIAADISFFGSLYREKTLAPRIFDTTGDQRLEDFVQGRVAMMVASTKEIPFLRERMGDNSFGITTIPVPAAGSATQYNIGLSGIYAGINANCAFPAEAWSFLEFLTLQSSLFCGIFNAVPGVVSDIIPGDYVKNDPFYSKAWDIFESSAFIEGFSGKPDAENYETAFIEELEIFFETNRTALETITAIQRRLRL